MSTDITAEKCRAYAQVLDACPDVPDAREARAIADRLDAPRLKALSPTNFSLCSATRSPGMRWTRRPRHGTASTPSSITSSRRATSSQNDPLSG